MTRMIRTQVGEIEVTMPADMVGVEIERHPGESAEEFAAAQATYDRLFRLARAHR